MSRGLSLFDSANLLRRLQGEVQIENEFSESEAGFSIDSQVIEEEGDRKWRAMRDEFRNWIIDNAA